MNPLHRLDDYVRGAALDDVEAYESDLFARALDGDAPELSALDSLAATLRVLAERGTLRNAVGPAEAAELRRRYGDRAEYHEMTADYAQHIALSRDAEIVITHVPLDLRDVERVDIENHVEGHGLLKTFPDMGFEPGSAGLYLCCEGTLARTTAGLTIVTKYWGLRGGERTLLRETRTETSIADV